MQTFFEQALSNTPQGQEAERILRSCVHCGFCTATCPTYRLLGDELDGPRGRIYLIKSMLEGKLASVKTMTHLDRCLTCRACETTCPSGVEYGKLLDIGRDYVERKVSRSWHERIYRFLILQTLPYRTRFKILLRTGQLFRFLLPGKTKKIIPQTQKKYEFESNNIHKRKVILLSGCVQSSLAPEINVSVKKILDALCVSTIEIKNEQCCGALSHHLNATDQALNFMQNNIDAIWPLIEEGVEAIISTASGCGVHVKDYGYLLREDDAYASKAKKVASLTKDISEYLGNFDLEKYFNSGFSSKPVSFQVPCTLQHGQKLNGVVEKILTRLGYNLTNINDAHLCCGSAGVYSLLQKEISGNLRKEKMESLLCDEPSMILTANIGCREHLKQVSPVPVRHWVEDIARLIS